MGKAREKGRNLKGKERFTCFYKEVWTAMGGKRDGGRLEDRKRGKGKERKNGMGKWIWKALDKETLRES